MLGQQFAKVLPTLGTGEVIRSVPQSTKTSVPSSIASGVVAAIGLQATPAQTAYEWDFGDGTTAQTTTPSVTHDYFPAIGGSDLAGASTSPARSCTTTSPSSARWC